MRISWSRSRPLPRFPADHSRVCSPAFQELTAAYGRLGAGVVSGPVAATVGVDQLGGLLVQVVEVVIRMRSRGDEVTRAHARALAATCLRICGVPEERIARAAASVEKRLA